MRSTDVIEILELKDIVRHDTEHNNMINVKYCSYSFTLHINSILYIE